LVKTKTSVIEFEVKVVDTDRHATMALGEM
jgi:hypothetical protein